MNRIQPKKLISLPSYSNSEERTHVCSAHTKMLRL